MIDLRPEGVYCSQTRQPSGVGPDLVFTKIEAVRGDQSLVIIWLTPEEAKTVQKFLNSNDLGTDL